MGSRVFIRTLTGLPPVMCFKCLLRLWFLYRLPCFIIAYFWYHQVLQLLSHHLRPPPTVGQVGQPDSFLYKWQLLPCHLQHHWSSYLEPLESTFLWRWGHYLTSTHSAGLPKIKVSPYNWIWARPHTTMAPFWRRPSRPITTTGPPIWNLWNQLSCEDEATIWLPPSQQGCQK